MKKWGIFLGGVGTGIVLTIVISVIINLGMNGDPVGVINFDQPGEVIHESSVEVLQVVTNTSALVTGSSGWPETVYLIRNHEGKYYYDNEWINLPEGTVFRQMGIYKYTSVSGDNKTVPIIEIIPKD